MISEISFVLNGEPCRVSGIDPTTTLLHYLRDHRGLCGSKEGCGEGDCGACTVAVGAWHADGVRYRAVNACIQFVAMLQGKAVWTVEGVRERAAPLHPVQRAFVDSHASQCGFCTPGFVMSLFAAHLNGDDCSDGEADDLFAGNLCRCTGYGSIVKAADEVAGRQPSAEDRERMRRDGELLKDMQAPETVSLSGNGGVFYSPAAADEAVRLYGENPDAVLVAGATDVGLWVTKQHRRLGTVIHLGRVAEWRRIEEGDGRLVLGAGVTYSEALPVLARHIPDFGELLRRLGARQVRNSGTVVGNIANGSPIGDTPPALMVLGAVLNLRKGDERRKLPLEDFFIDYGKQDRRPGEVIESVEIPLPADPAAARFYKVSKRFDQDISAICGCFNLSIEDGTVRHARIAFGGMAAIPKRARAVEEALAGKPWTEATLDAAMQAFEVDFTPISDMRASADYRMQVAKNLLRRFWLESSMPTEKTRLAGSGAIAL